MIREPLCREEGLAVYCRARSVSLKGHPPPGRRGAHAARPLRRSARVRDRLRPPRRSRVLARLPHGGQQGGCRGRGAGGFPVDLAQPPALRVRARQRALLGARHRSPPDHRRAQAYPRPRPPQDERRGPRGATGGTRADGRRGGSPRGGPQRARRPRDAPGPADEGDRTGVLRRLHPHSDSRDARHADRHREGADAARPRETASPALGRARRGACAVSEHDRLHDDTGAYLLGALEPAEQAEFERHLAGCPECRSEVEELRMAADALPRSVEPFAPPPSLKRSLMEAVREDVKPARRPLLERLGLSGARVPRLAIAGAAFALVVGVVLGTQLSTGDGGGHRVIAAVPDRSRVPDASATVTVPEGRDGPAQIRVTGLPSPKPGQVYEIWLKRGDQLQPGPLFNVDARGNGAGAIPDDLDGVSAVLVTRERTGGAQVPSEAPIISARL